MKSGIIILMLAVLSGCATHKPISSLSDEEVEQGIAGNWIEEMPDGRVSLHNFNEDKSYFSTLYVPVSNDYYGLPIGRTIPTGPTLREVRFWGTWSVKERAIEYVITTCSDPNFTLIGVPLRDTITDYDGEYLCYQSQVASGLESELRRYKGGDRLIDKLLVGY